jgi:BMFP domain-containing protein YqiC
MIQDVTARWQQQKELRARLAALEAKTAEAPQGSS